MSSAFTPTYPDRWLTPGVALFSAYLIEQLGRDQSPLALLQQPFFYRGVGSGFLIAWLVMAWIGWITRRLDRRYDWITRPGHRTASQLALGLALPAVFVLLLVDLQFRYILHTPVSLWVSEWLLYEYPMAVTLLLLWNGFYLTAWFYQRVRQPGLTPEPIAATSAPPPPRQVILVQQGGRRIPLPISEVAYVYRQAPYNYLQTFTGNAYLIDETLDELYTSLNKADFFRANRQTIVHFRACTAFVPQSYGKLEVQLSPPPHEPVIISQKRAPEFRAWVNR